MKHNPSDILVSFSRRITERVLEELGRDSVRSVFLSGSTVRGEVSAYQAGDVLEIYSDVDVWVIMNDGADIPAARSRVREIAEAAERRGDGYHIFPRPDVGVVSVSDFAGQPGRPGTVDLSAARELLYGDDLPSANGWRPPDIDPLEALYLLENRAVEWADVRDRLTEDADDGLRRFAAYALLKAGLDTGSALLIALGRFRPMRVERMRALDEEAAGTPLIANATRLWIERCHTSLGDMQASLPDIIESFDEIEDAVRSLLLDSWKRVAGRIRGGERAAWPELVKWRCSGQGRRANLRELLILAKRLSVPRLRAVRHAGSRGRYSAIHTLRIAGIVEALAAANRDEATTVERSYAPTVDALTREFGLTDGTLYRRARRLYKLVVQ
jgi:hypothetical protein